MEMRVGQILVVSTLLMLAITAKAQIDSLVLVRPAGGEILYTNRDSVITIEWSGVADTLPVRLEWTNDSRDWTIIADSATGLRYSWLITGIPISSTLRVRVLQARAPLGSDNAIYTGHLGVVTAGAWSPDASRAVTVSATPDIWDAEVGGPAPITSLPVTRSKLLGVSWSSDSSLIWTFDQSSNGLLAFQTTTNTQAYQYQCNCDAFTFDVSRSGKRVAIAGPRSVHVVEFPKQTPIRQILTPSDVLDVSLDTTENKVLVCTDQASVYPTGGGLPLVFRKHSGGVLGGAFQPGGAMIATIGGDATLRLWNSITAVEQWNSQAAPEGMRSLAFSSDGTRIAVGMSDSTLTIWDASTGALLHRVAGTGGAVRQIEWAPQADQIVTAGDANVANVINVAEGRIVNRLSHQNDVTSAHWSKDGGSILTTSLDGTAAVWRIREVILQADTSAPFSYAPPPPTFARFHTTGGRVEIGKDLSVTLSLEDAAELRLSDIDSVQFQLAYDASILYQLSTTIPIVNQRDSSFHRIITLAPIVLPKSNGILGTFSYKATLGTDSVTTIAFVNVKQIGRGPAVRVETEADTIVVAGICRAANSSRLYSSVGMPINADIRRIGGSSTLALQVGETGNVDVRVFDLTGQQIWSQSFTRKLGDVAQYSICLDSVPPGTLRLVVITTATQQTSCIWEDVR